MQLEPVIGLEIHVQLTTKSKMFCSCANIFGDVPPNSAICPICMGYPGTLPVPNTQAIEWTRLAGAALGCRLATKSKFDRKSYFYPDLPKGYQISQYDQPFCREGKITLEDGREIRINRIHLEEDAAKNIHPEGADYTLIDFNRAGTPLIEIVTEPDIKTPAEAKKFLQNLQAIIRRLGISTADMEKGQMRCDANISLRPAGENELYPKTEIKNLNSFRNVEAALLHEIARQTAAWQKNDIPQAATRGWDADAGETQAQRTKEAEADYRYFPEPDIPPFEFTDEENRAVVSSLPELPTEQSQRFMREYAVNDSQANMLVSQPDLAEFFEAVVSEIKQLDNEQVGIMTKEVKDLVQLAYNLITREIRNSITKEKIKFSELKISPENFAELVALLHHNRINSKSAPKVLDEMQRTGGDPDAIIANLGLEQVSDESDLMRYAQEVIDSNPEVVARIQAGKSAAIQFLVGQVMAKTGGTANPKVVVGLLKKKIESQKK
jgi:aspartyl-tRNA(Asn)/glutamyl-tRNA(Gln) amidotransferase subunit B